MTSSTLPEGVGRAFVTTLRDTLTGAADALGVSEMTIRRDLDELDGFLEHLTREVYDPDFARLLRSFMGDDGFRADFRRAPCTRNGHHAYLGGLLEHTVAVATLAQETCVLHPRLNSDVLLCAAVLHDAGKIQEFELGAGMVIPGWDKGLEGMKVGGRRKLTIPPDQAYGEQGSPPTIGPNVSVE